MARVVDADQFKTRLAIGQLASSKPSVLGYCNVIALVDELSVEVPDTPKEEWVCGTCHAVVRGEFCVKCHPAETKKLSLMLEYLRVCRVLGEFRGWLEQTVARMADAIAKKPDQLTEHTLASGKAAAEGAIRKLDELQAKKEGEDGKSG